MKREEKTSKRIFLIVISLSLLSIFTFLYNSVPTETLTGFSVKDTVSMAYQNSSPLAKISLITQNVLLFFALYISKKKRAQTAMEFIMTYQWALFALLVAIGILAYWNVFNPNEYAPGSAIVNAPFYIKAWEVNGAENQVLLEIENHGLEPYVITEVAIETKKYGCTTGVGVWPIELGDSIVSTTWCSPDLVKNDRIEGSITIKYDKSGSELSSLSSGSISEKILEGYGIV